MNKIKIITAKFWDEIICSQNFEHHKGENPMKKVLVVT